MGEIKVEEGRKEDGGEIDVTLAGNVSIQSREGRREVWNQIETGAKRISP